MWRKTLDIAQLNDANVTESPGGTVMLIGHDLFLPTEIDDHSSANAALENLIDLWAQLFQRAFRHKVMERSSFQSWASFCQRASDRL